MPYPKDMVNSLKKKYGKDASHVLFGMKANRPQQFAKAVKTASKSGHGGNYEHSSVIKGMIKKKRKSG
jgi:hypothetical protein